MQNEREKMAEASKDYFILWRMGENAGMSCPYFVGGNSQKWNVGHRREIARVVNRMVRVKNPAACIR